MKIIKIIKLSMIKSYVYHSKMYKTIVCSLNLYVYNKSDKSIIFYPFEAVNFVISKMDRFSKSKMLEAVLSVKDFPAYALAIAKVTKTFESSQELKDLCD